MQPRAAAWLLLALLVDAAAETFWSGSPVRGWVVGIMLVYAATTGALWTRTTWGTKLWASCLVLMALLAITAWLPEGLTNGVRLLGLSTGRVLSLAASLGVVLAGVVLMRVPKVPRAARWVLGVLATYGAVAFVHGAATAVPFPALLAGQSLWQTLPFVLQGTVVGGLIVLPLALVASVVTAGLRSPAPGSSIRTIRQAAALATSLAIVAAALPQRDALAGAPSTIVATSPASTSSTIAAASPERLAALENSFRAIEDGLRESPRDRWDPDYVVQQVGTDPQRLFEWVRDNTSWIPYRGALRGAVGVLNDRLGNSLDRAVLLATLLQKTGHTVRLARRELGVEEGLELTSWVMTGSLPGEAPAEVADGEDETADSEIPAIAAQYQLDPARVERTLSDRALAIETLISDLDARVEDQTRRLLSTLETPTAEEEWSRRIEAAAAAVRDHWWVQRQDGATWVDLDVLGPDVPGGGPAPAAAQTLTLAEIAPLHHELAVRVIAEQWSGGATSERQTMEHVWRPAETIGQAVVLQFWPSDWRADAEPTADNQQESFRAMALEQRQWDIGLAIGGAVVAEASLSASGNPAAPPKGGPMGALGGRLAQALSGGSDESDRALTAVWVEYEIRSPAAPPRRIRREVFDLLGPAARAAKTTFTLSDPLRLARSLSLMMRTEILPINCGLASEYVADLAGRSLMADRALLMAAVKGEIAPGTPQTEQLLNDGTPALTPLYAFALARLEWSRYTDQIFIDRLNVLARHRFFASARDGLVVREATDIVANEVGVELSALDAFAIRVEQGVFETNAERMLQMAGRPIGNTADAFGPSADWVTLRTREGIDQLRVSDDARLRIADDLEAGYAVVASPAPVTIGSEPFVGWWRVDRATGDTLGVAANGWGQAMAERGVQYSVFREMAKRFVFDYLLCQSIPIVANAARPMVTDLFGTPSWVTPPGQKTSHELSEGNSRGCLISAIASGAAFATLPLLLATLKYAGRSIARQIPRIGSGPKFPRWGPKIPGRPPRPPGRPGTKPATPPKVRPPC